MFLFELPKANILRLRGQMLGILVIEGLNIAMSCTKIVLITSRWCQVCIITRKLADFDAKRSGGNCSNTFCSRSQVKD